MVSKKEGNYHHGNLQKALLNAALQLVAESGIEGLSLRQVALRAGVSSAAPYHHFVDKAALVDALRNEYFSQFGEALKDAADELDLPTSDKLKAIGKAYILYGVKNPDAFRLMFRTERHILNLKSSVKNEECRTEKEVFEHMSEGGFGVLFNLIVTGQAQGDLIGGSPLPLALTAWSTVHGITTLLLDGPTDRLYLGEGDLEQEIDRLADTILTNLLSGMLMPHVDK